MSFWSIIWEYLISKIIIITAIFTWFLLLLYIFFPEGLINFIHKDRQRAEKMKREARKRLAQFNMQRREKLKNNPDSQKEKKN